MKITLKKVHNTWTIGTIFCIESTTLASNEYIAGCIAQKLALHKMKILILGDDGFALPQFREKLRDGISPETIKEIEQRILVTIDRSFAYILAHESDRIIAEHFNGIICLFPHSMMYDKFLKKLPDLAPISFVFKEYRKWFTPMTPFLWDELLIDRVIRDIVQLQTKKEKKI